MSDREALGASMDAEDYSTDRERCPPNDYDRGWRDGHRRARAQVPQCATCRHWGTHDKDLSIGTKVCEPLSEALMILRMPIHTAAWFGCVLWEQKDGTGEQGTAEG